jgi:outer membrane protein assembly factor BamB
LVALNDPAGARMANVALIDSSGVVSVAGVEDLGSMAMRFGSWVSGVSVAVLCCVLPLMADDVSVWPQFRGPGARGVAVATGVPEVWSATENVEWKRDVAGRGWSSPVVWGESVFLTTVVNTGKSEEPKKGLYFGGDRTAPPQSVHQWKVLCLDLATGAVRWERQVHEGQPQSSIHIKSSFASETAVTDGERVYFCFGNVGIFCFDFAGSEVWRHELPALPMRFGWGTAASPALHDGRLYYCGDNEQQSYLLALDAATGKQLWRTEREDKSNWSTPFVWQHQQRTEIVVAGTGGIQSYDPDGQLLWSTRGGMSSITIATPYAADGLLYVSSGYVLDQQRPIYAIRPGAAGDISLAKGESSNQFIVWSQAKAGPYNPSTLVSGSRLFVLYDRGFFAGFDALTGGELFGQQRLPNGRAFTASPWAADGKIFCLNEDGVTFVLRDSDQYELIRTNSLAEDDMGMATPAIIGDRLLIRTAARIYSIRSAKRD